MRKITEIIVHCTATRSDWWSGKPAKAKVAEVRKWHVEGNKWKDIGYHYLIDRDGTVVSGRDVETVGAHVKDHNIGTIGVALFGGHGSEATDKFEDHFTKAQDAALRKLIADLRVRFGDLKVSGHNEYAAKACPGFYAPAWFKKPLPEPEVKQEKPKSLIDVIVGIIMAFISSLKGGKR